MDRLLNLLFEITPFLAGGFFANLWISILAMLLGTLLGTLIAAPIVRNWTTLKHTSSLLVSLTRNVPSFVLMFYIAFILPETVTFAGIQISLTSEYKAVLALTFPVIGFAADQFIGLVKGSGNFDNYIASWIQYLIIILMASVTASVIGADEVLSRANKLISTRPELDTLITIYVYISLWFVAVSVAFNVAIKALLMVERKASLEQSNVE